MHAAALSVSLPPHDLRSPLVRSRRYGFNAGSTMHMDAAHAKTAARVAVTTTLAASAGGVSAVFATRFGCGGGQTRSWEVAPMCNGILAGLVSITSGCATVEPWAAVLIGVVGSLLHLASSYYILRSGIYDPLDAAAVHGTGGTWALLSAAFLSTGDYTADVYGPQLAPGLLYVGSRGERLAVACVFVVAEVLWVGATSTLIFRTLRALRILRAVDRLDTAEIDMDASRVGGEISMESLAIAWEPPVASPAGQPHATTGTAS